MSDRWQRRLPWLAGFLIPVNLYLVPSLAMSPRLTDLAGALLGLFVLMRLARGRQRREPLVAVAALSVLPAVWLFFSLLDGDVATVSQAARWLLAAPWALVLMQVVLPDDDTRNRFAWGLLIGTGVNMGVIVAQHLGFEWLMRLLGLSSSGAAWHHWVSHTVRIPGLHGHANASSAVVSLAVPAAMYLYLKRRCGVGVLAAALLGMMVSLHLTSSRSPLIVALLTILFAVTIARRLGRGVVVAIFLLALVAPLLAVYGPPGGWSRWRNVQAVTANAGERLDSSWGAIKLGSEHPAGLGVTRGHYELAQRTTFRSPHNAFLQVSLFFGLPFGLLVFAGIAGAALRGLRGAGSPGFLLSLLAFHLAGLFLFEEHLNNPTFVVLAAWMVAAMTWRPANGAPGEIRRQDG